MEELIIAVDSANTALNTFLIDTVSLHSDNPSTTGLNELSSVGYARQSFTFQPAVAGKRNGATSVSFNLTTGDTIAWIAYWYQGVFVIAKKVDPALVFNQDGTAVLNETTVLEL